MRYVRENLKQSFSSWGRVEMAVALAGYVIAALVLFFPASRLGGNLVATIFAALGLAIVAWFLVLVLVVTPARMWYGAQRQMASLLEQQRSTAAPGMTAIAVSDQGSVHMQDVQISMGGTPAPTLAQPQTPEASWLAETHLSHRSFRIYDVPRDDDGVIRNRIFEECTIYGPAIIAPVGESEFRDSVWESSAEATLWEVAPGYHVGAIGVEGCAFRRCRFIAIGIAGVPELIQHVRKALGAPE